MKGEKREILNTQNKLNKEKLSQVQKNLKCF